MVTAVEAAALLFHAAGHDNRNKDTNATRAWSAALSDIDFEDAKTAIDRHYAVNRQWIMPSDVRDGVKAIENERLAAAPNVYELEPPAHVRDKDGAEGDALYLDWIQETTRKIRRGEPYETGERPPAVDDADRIRELVAAVRAEHRAS